MLSGEYIITNICQYLVACILTVLPNSPMHILLAQFTQIIERILRIVCLFELQRMIECISHVRSENETT